MNKIGFWIFISYFIIVYISFVGLLILETIKEVKEK